MAAAPAGPEEATIAMPLSILVSHGMSVIFPIHCHGKLLEMKTLPFLSVALGLVNLANHTRVHGQVSPFKDEHQDMKKGTRKFSRAHQLLNSELCSINSHIRESPKLDIS